MMDPLPIALSEDEIDDILYSARTNDLHFLKSLLAELSIKFMNSPGGILKCAVDFGTANTALHMAAGNGNTEIIQYILSVTPSAANESSPGAEIPFHSIPNASFNTPLHWAALNGHLSSVQLLVETGAYISKENSAGHDALFEAERGGHDEVAGWLAGVLAKKEGGQGAEIDMDGAEGQENERDKGSKHPGKVASGSLEGVEEGIEKVRIDGETPP